MQDSNYKLTVEIPGSENKYTQILHNFPPNLSNNHVFNFAMKAFSVRNSLSCSILLVFTIWLPSTRTILGGHNARFCQEPCMYYFRVGSQFKCGGTVALINGKQVFITSATCVMADVAKKTVYEPKDITLVGGQFRLLYDYPAKSGCNTIQERDGQYIRFHKDFNPVTLENDIALIFFEEPFEQTDAVDFVSIPALGWLWGPQHFGRIAGFGAPGSLAQLSDYLKIRSNLSTLPDEDCKLVEMAPRRITQKHLCVRPRSMKGVGTCDTDRGSPYITQDGLFKKVLVGIISYENTLSCGNYKAATVLIQVSYFSDWIIETSNRFLG